MHGIVVPVKFEGGLSISLLRKKQLFTKKRGSKVYVFKKVPIFINISNPAIWKKVRCLSYTRGLRGCVQDLK
jgi:hypothetical protein